MEKSYRLEKETDLEIRAESEKYYKNRTYNDEEELDVSYLSLSSHS